MTPIVDRIASLNLPGPTPVGVPIAAAANPTVTLTGGSSYTLDAKSAKTPHYLRMLGMLHHAGMLVYLETDPATNAVTRLLIPRVFEVESIAAKPSGDRLAVRFHVSHAIHFISTTNPNYKQLVAALKTAHQSKKRVVVTEEPDRPEIIDVRPANSPLTVAPPAAGVISAPSPKVSPPLAVAVPLSDAQAMFDLVNGQSCPTTMSVPTCIPFLYPDDGCWARAHEMCRLMIANGVTPMKVWLYGTLHVNTKNSPVCHVDWGWHVAPLLLVDTGISSDQYVIDPSLFSGPAPLSDWIAIQNTTIPPSVSETSDATVYRTSRLTGGDPQYDPGYAQTNTDLNTYRMLFANRCAVDNPPGPPYACP